MTRFLIERKVDHTTEFNGMDLAIEVPAGAKRTGSDRNGKKWESTVSANYGYIKGTNSPDGEPLDIWLRKTPKKNSSIYVVHQLTPDGLRYDEDKAMLGYASKDEATKAYKEHAYKPNEMFGGISEFSQEHFKIMAYSARKSKAILADEDMFEKLKEKDLIPRGIKSPLQVAKAVSENLNTGLRQLSSDILKS